MFERTAAPDDKLLLIHHHREGLGDELPVSLDLLLQLLVLLFDNVVGSVGRLLSELAFEALLLQAGIRLVKLAARFCQFVLLDLGPRSGIGILGEYIFVRSIGPGQATSMGLTG